MMLAARELTLCAGGAVFPVWKVDLDLEKGDRLAIVGESGGGKTSLAWALIGRPQPGQVVLAGEVSFCGAKLMGLPPRERALLYYRQIALVPQNAQEAFHPAQPLWKSAREMIAKNGPARHDRKATMDLLAPFSRSLDLSPSLWSHYPHQLSGGQKQRMALILALLNRPKVLLLDEPGNALDEITRDRVISYLGEWMAAGDTSMILFTHDMGMACRWAGRIAVLYRGEIVEELPAEMIERPLHPYSRGLIDAAVRLGDAPLSRLGIPGHALPLSHSSVGCGFMERCPHVMNRCRQQSPRLESRGPRKVRCFMEQAAGQGRPASAHNKEK